MPEKILTEKISSSKLIRIAGVEAFAFGCVLIALGFVLVHVQDFAVNLVEMAMARYENLTGKIALNVFGEDRALMQQLLVVKDSLLPLLSMGIPLAFAFGFPLAIFGIVVALFPFRVENALSKIRWLCKKSCPDTHQNSTALHQKKSAALVLCGIGICASLLIVLGLGLGGNSSDGAEILEREAARFVGLERSYFHGKKSLGTWSQIGYEPLESEFFSFEKAGNSAWKAVSLRKIGDCPEGNGWRIGFELKGVFDKEMKTYVTLPKDSNCVKLSPDFRKKIFAAD